MTAATDRPAVDDSLVGALLDGRYRVTSLIGRGGVATVYRATDTALGRDVAIKVFRGVEGLDDPARRESERALLASVAHPALVMLHDAVHERATAREFLVMELVEGPNLRERLDEGPLTAAEAAAMTIELAEALHVIHARGIVHRDVKPANVLLAPSLVPTRDWHAKLADFGIARLVDDSRLTATGGLIGTPQYLAPEQVRGEGATSASDIYALGLLVLESRTGRAVFPGPALEAASARLTRDPELPEFLGPDWRQLLASMLSRRPDDRPAALDVAVAAATLGPDLGPDLRPDLWPDPAAAGADETAPLEEAAFVDRGAAATMLLTEHAARAPGNVPPRATPGPTRQAPSAQTPERDAAARSGDGGRRRRTWLVPLAVIAPLVLAAAIVVPLLFAAIGEGTAPPTPSPIPSVPGELGVHLEELQEAVTP